MTLKTVIQRLPKDGDLLDEIAELAKKNDINHASIQVIGALERAELAFYRQAEHEYVSHPVEAPTELIAGLGNISLRDGEIFVHLHLSLSFEDGSATGGHAMPGCKIFAAECIITEMPGDAPERVLDQPTGLYLW